MRPTERAVGSDELILSNVRSRSASGCKARTWYWKRSAQSSQPCRQSRPLGSARFTFAPALLSKRTVCCTTDAVSAETLTSGLLSMNAMRRSFGLAAGAGPSGTGAPSASWPSGPSMMRSAVSRSSTERAKGPNTPIQRPVRVWPGRFGTWPRPGTRHSVGFSEKMPL